MNERKCLLNAAIRDACSQESIPCLKCGDPDEKDFVLCSTCDNGGHCKCLGLAVRLIGAVPRP